MSIPIPEAPMSRGWADIHMVKGVLYALVLTCRNKSFSATENRIGCIAKEETWNVTVVVTTRIQVV